MRSDSLKQLLPALSKAHESMDNPKKGKVNPAFKSGYVDLPGLLECIKEPLAENDLHIVHYVATERGAEGFPPLDMLVTVLYHGSGEFIDSRMPLRPVKNDPQGIGSAVTYARRYNIMALLNLAAEDDDGNAASSPGQKKAASKMKQSGTGFRPATTQTSDDEE